MATTALSKGQTLLLRFLDQHGARIVRDGAAYRLVRPQSSDMVLTEQAVREMAAAGYVRQTEAYGRDRGIYEISKAGKNMLHTEKSIA